MRNLAVLLATASFLIPSVASAQSSAVSSLQLAHSALKPGQTETVLVTARDLAGNPLSGAAVLAVVHFGSASQTFQMRQTDGHGRSALAFQPPVGLANVKAAINVTISNGYLQMSLSSSFTIGAPTAPPAPVSLVVQPRVLPAEVTAPAPAWVVASVHTRAGKAQSSARVAARILFKEGTRYAKGTTDSSGVATFRVDTSLVRSVETVRVLLSATWQQERGASTAQFQARPPSPTATAPPPPTPTPTPIPAPSPTPIPTPSPTPTPTWTPVPTDSPTPTATSVPAQLNVQPLTSTQTPTQTPTNTPTPTPTDTPTPAPTATLVPTPTYTPLSTFTPTDTPTPTNTALPTAGAMANPDCPGSQNGCITAMLGILNGTRGQSGLAPLHLSMTQSVGTSSCVGSYGHSKDMAASGQIWHQNASYPDASWPNNMCISYSSGGENVGVMSSGNELQDLQGIHNLMMGEAHDASTCAHYVNHACNILSTQFATVGIGIYYANGSTWLTEDFAG